MDLHARAATTDQLCVTLASLVNGAPLAASQMEYIPITNVLRSRFESGDARWEIIDFAPRTLGSGGQLDVPHELVRLILPLAGIPRLVIDFRPRPDYGRAGGELLVTPQVFGATKPSRTLLLEPTCKVCDPDRGVAASQDSAWAVSTELASQAIHAERAALDALGTLPPSAAGTLPAVKIAGDACRVDVLVDKQRITGVMKMSTTQCITNGGNGSFRKARLRDVQLSPDRRKLAVTLTVEPRFFEWGDPVDLTIVVDAN